MATSQQFLVCDNSTAANFKSWASAVSNIIRTFGWTNTSDTGQLNGAGAGNWAGVSTVPGSGLFYYEIFQPGDALTPFYLKLEYGNGGSAANCPSFRISIGTSTNGAGTLTGNVTQTVILVGTAFTAPSTTATFECDFSGTTSRLGIMMWRTSTATAAPQLIAIQRSLNSSGAETSSYVTLWGCGWNNNGNVTGYQQSLHFTAGVAPYFPSPSITGNCGGWPTRGFGMNSRSATFNGAIAVDFLQPMIGYWDYPCTVLGTANAMDMAEGVPFTLTNQYGQTKTYMPSKSSVFLQCSIWGSFAGGSSLAVCMEYD